MLFRPDYFVPKGDGDGDSHHFPKYTLNAHKKPRLSPGFLRPHTRTVPFRPATQPICDKNKTYCSIDNKQAKAKKRLQGVGWATRDFPVPHTSYTRCGSQAIHGPWGGKNFHSCSCHVPHLLPKHFCSTRFVFSVFLQQFSLQNAESFLIFHEMPERTAFLVSLSRLKSFSLFKYMKYIALVGKFKIFFLGNYN